MSLSNKHPQYSEIITDWTLMRDVYAGQRQVKSKTTTYLSPTSGMIADGMTAKDPGYAAYVAYLMRAVLPGSVSDAVEKMIGAMHHKPPVIDLPAELEPLRKRASRRGESLEVLLQRINEEQLVLGRLGLLADFAAGKTVGAKNATLLPKIALYQGETIINWDEGDKDNLPENTLNLIVLDESGLKRNDEFNWETVDKYRVLILGKVEENETEAVYRFGVFEDETAFSEGNLITPSLRGNTMDRIPFQIINSKDVIVRPDDPPLLSLGNLALTIYRGEADYRQGLFMQGQDTLVVVGATDTEATVRTGANATIHVPIGGSAKFEGVDSAGLAEMREGLTNDYQRANQHGGQLLDSVSRERESGDALHIRVSASTATLNQVAKAGAFGLEEILKDIATWVGANPEEVKVTPNLDFTGGPLPADDAVKIQTSKNMGAPLSQESIHAWMKERGFTGMEFEAEMALIAEETPLSFALTGGNEPFDDGGGDD